MLIGKSYAQRYADEQRLITKHLVFGRKEFRTWCRLRDGRNSWFQTVWSYPHVSGAEGRLFIWSASPDSYSPMYDFFDHQLSLTELQSLYQKDWICLLIEKEMNRFLVSCTEQIAAVRVNKKIKEASV